MSAIGIDIGGSRVRLVMADTSGQVLGRASLRTMPEAGAADTIGRIVEAAFALQRKAATTIEAIGIGVTGPVDPYTGIVDNPYTLGGWPPTDVRTPFERAFGVPVAVDNDANVAALGEWWTGAGKGSRRLVMVTIGTGIGVAVLIEGALQRAVDGRHGEAGHMLLDPSGPECYCGGRGCWEVLASGPAIGRAARDQAMVAESAVARLSGGDPGRADAPLLFEAAAEGDALAHAVVEVVARYTGMAFVNLASTVMPDLIVVAGGVSDHLPALLPGIEDVLRRHAVMAPTNVPVVAARLGEDAGPIGAAQLAFKRLV